MGIEGKLTARDIVNKAGMSDRPEYYSGRGAISCDLNSSQLSKIHGLIKKEYGSSAAKNFVKMIANVKDLAASNFLTCLYFLEARKWEYSGFQSDLGGGIAVSKDKDGNYDLTHGMIGIAEYISRGNRDETESIRQPFLESVGFNLDRKKRIIDEYRLLQH